MENKTRKILRKRGCLRGFICERERAYVRTRKAKSRNKYIIIDEDVSLQ